MPFRAVMESLGAGIGWDAKAESVSINYNGKRYLLQTKPNLSLYEEGTPRNDLFIPVPGGTRP